MRKAPTIRLSRSDYWRLCDLLDNAPKRIWSSLEPLEDELMRAEIIPDENMPPDVVTLYSTVLYEEVETGKLTTLQLTFPEDANIEEGKISVLAPVGAALLGLKVGQEISWSLPDGRHARFRVKRLVRGLDPHAAESSEMAQVV